MKVLFDGKTVEWEAMSGAELYEAVEKKANDPGYKTNYAFSFSEFFPLSEKQKFFSIEASELLSVIKCKYRLEQRIAAEQHEKMLAVKLDSINGPGFPVFLGYMVFYKAPENS